jgi:V/A-type H+-transporting ATPase subunit A
MTRNYPERRVCNLSGKVVKVSGPLVVATGLADANMSDVVRVGPQRLIGEILTMKGDTASIQVYEETSGLGPGAEVDHHRRAAERGAGVPA